MAICCAHIPTELVMPWCWRNVPAGAQGTSAQDQLVSCYEPPLSHAMNASLFAFLEGEKGVTVVRWQCSAPVDHSLRQPVH